MEIPNEIPRGWNQEGSKLLLTVKCKDFKHALALINSIGNIAEKHGHHPDLSIRNYNELFASTTTHDVGELTEKDYPLAQEIADLIDHQE